MRKVHPVGQEVQQVQGAQRVAELETAPRCHSGTRSGTAAVSDASIELKQAWASIQPSATPAMVCWPDSSTRASAPTTALPKVQTCRRPYARPRSVNAVRSDSAP